MKLFSYYFFIIWILLSFEGTSSQDLIVTPSGTQVKGLGEDLVLTCKLASGFDPIGVIINIQWFSGSTGFEILDRTPGRDNTPYIDKSIPQTSKLYINDILPKHAGTYTCSAMIGGNRESVAVTLEVLREITVDAPSEQYPQIYSDATIFCKVTGQPTPEVFWRYKGVRLIGGRYSQDLYGLRIRNITEQDNGLYDCCAEIESLGRVHIVPINVIVRVPPRITYFEDSEGISSQQFAFVCNATALPPAKYEFYKDGNPQVVFSTDRIMVDRDGGELVFRPLIPEDRGVYTCKAFNDVGEASKIATLTIVVPPKIYSVRNVTQTEGKSTTLVCLTYGDPAPDMTFRKDGLTQSYIMGSNDGGRIQLFKPGPLELDMTIFPLRWDDTSNYTCIAKNKGGIHVWNGSIIVQYVPRFSPEMPHVVYNWAGKTRNLTCLVYSEPKPIVEWWRLGRLLQNNETFRIYYINKDSNLQVTIRQVDEYYIYGEYFCRARNNIGTNETSIEMRRAFLPDAPTSASVIRATPTTLELIIIPPGPEGLYGLPLLGFWVQVETRVIEFLLTERIFLEYLRPSNAYELIVRVRTEIGIGSILRITGRTLDISSPYPITINSDPRSNFPFEYTVTWMRPETGGLPVREYQFRFRQVSVEPGTFKLKEGLSEWRRRIKNTDISFPSMFYRLQGLLPNTYYQLEIQARNDVGWSIPNAMYIFKTSFDPLQDPYEMEDCSPNDFRNIHSTMIISLACLSTFLNLYV